MCMMIWRYQDGGMSFRIQLRPTEFRLEFSLRSAVSCNPVHSLLCSAMPSISAAVTETVTETIHLAICKHIQLIKGAGLCRGSLTPLPSDENSLWGQQLRYSGYVRSNATRETCGPELVTLVCSIPEAVGPGFVPTSARRSRLGVDRAPQHGASCEDGG